MYQHEELVKEARDKYGDKIFLCQELAAFSLMIAYDCHKPAIFHLPNIYAFFHTYEYGRSIFYH